MPCALLQARACPKVFIRPGVLSMEQHHRVAVDRGSLETWSQSAEDVMTCSLLIQVRDYLEMEFRPRHDETQLPFDFDLERVIDDFVLFCMLIGNDFLPCEPLPPSFEQQVAAANTGDGYAEWHFAVSQIQQEDALLHDLNSLHWAMCCADGV